MNKLRVYEKILSKIEEGVHVVDQSGKTIIYNHAMSKMEGMKREDVLQENLLKVLPNLGYGSTHLEVLKTGKSIESNYQEYLSKQGKRVVAINSTYPIIEKGEVIGSFEISKDITYMRKMSEKMLGLYNKVEDAKKGTYSFEDIIGESQALKDVIDQSRQVAQTSSNVLIVGASGTGKELFAHSIHNSSLRRDKPLLAENCAAIPENLLESILFGTTKGSFTGAEDRTGILKQVDGGTLILDEINSMPLNLQSKLLRVIETKRFRPIGSNKEEKVDVRIIAITNQEPIELVKKNLLREDLFYRLSVINLRIPGLLERKEDIAIYSDYFIQLYEKLLNKKTRGLSKEAEQFFHTYEWPGNVRELKHVIEGAMTMMKDGEAITLKQMPYYMKSQWRMDSFQEGLDYWAESQYQKIKDDQQNLEHAVDELEKSIIIKSLKRNMNNITQAAQELGIKRQGLQYKIKKHQIQI